MKVIILAGGRGTRLSKSAKNNPKPLVKINNKTILDYQLKFLEKQGFCDIRLSLGYQAEKIIKHLKNNYGNKYEWVIENFELGTGGALKLASGDLKEDFLAFNVDDFPTIDLKDFVNFHKNHNLNHTIAIYKVNNAEDFGLVDYNNGIIKKFLEKPKKKTSGYINTGFYILNPEIFKDFKKTKFSVEKEIFPLLVKQNQLAAYDDVKHWLTTGTEERLKRARKFFKDN
jgi:mannose-1-phosphate guanylyltransferase